MKAVIPALLCTVGMIVPASAGDRSSPFLKGVKIVSYKLSVEPPNKGRCAIDLKAWNTAIEPVANQSTKLKLIRDADHLEQEKQLSDELRKTSENVERHLTDETAKKEHDEAEERWKKFLLAPTLSFSVLTTDLGIGCAGTLSVEVIVGLEPSKIIATDTPVHIPLMTIWSDHQLLSAPYETFSSFAVQTSEQTLKPDLAVMEVAPLRSTFFCRLSPEAVDGSDASTPRYQPAKWRGR